jgi:TonB-dependent SusC/RagA subfamily outer membrane receptor
MMKNSNSNPWMRSKALYVIPVAALALSAFATPKFVTPIKDAVTKLEGKSTENSPNLQDFLEEKEEITVKDVSGKATASVDEVQDAAQPLIVLNGKIIEVSKDVNFETMNSEEQFSSLLNINVEDIESITVLKNDAATKVWGDKGANGVIVITTKSKDDVKELVKKLPGAEMDDDGNITVGGKSVAKIMLEDKTIFNNNDTIYNVVKERAKYPGGDEACLKFISENVRYPKLCHEFGVQGRVIVRFVIEKDGSITHVEKVRGVGKTLSEVEVTSYKKEHPDSPEQLKAGQDLGDLLFGEAKRVMELMPKWEPAKDKEGNPVRSFFNLPFMFRLQ